MKLLFILLSLLLYLYPTVSFAHAEADSNTCPFKSSFYGGIRAGLSHLHSTFKPSTQFLEFPEFTVTHDSKLNSTLGFGGFQFGYLFRWPNSLFIISPEAFFIYNPASMNRNKEGELDLHKIKTTFSFGLNIRLGGLITNNLFAYVYTGITCSPFKFQEHDTLDNIRRAQQTKYGNALNYGAGLEYELQNTHRVRLEIGSSDYKSMHFSTIAPNKLTYHTATFKPRTYSATLMYSIPL